MHDPWRECSSYRLAEMRQHRNLQISLNLEAHPRPAKAGLAIKVCRLPPGAKFSIMTSGHNRNLQQTCVTRDASDGSGEETLRGSSTSAMSSRGRARSPTPATSCLGTISLSIALIANFPPSRTFGSIGARTASFSPGTVARSIDRKANGQQDKWGCSACSSCSVGPGLHQPDKKMMARTTVPIVHSKGYPRGNRC